MFSYNIAKTADSKAFEKACAVIEAGIKNLGTARGYMKCAMLKMTEQPDGLDCVFLKTLLRDMPGKFMLTGLRSIWHYKRADRI